MKLSRKAIQRMVDSGQVNIGGRRTGSGGGGGGGVSATWVEENYISKAFFNTLFTIHGHDADDQAVPPTDVIIEPNDTETVLDSIEAMVGLWTEKYLSALGLSSGGGGGGDVLAEPLVSINGIGSPAAANQTLVWNGSRWTFQPYGQGGGSVTSIRITVPAGFNVSPSTAITTSGTFAITFASGYSLPTTAKQSNWDTAYTWVNANGASTVSKTAWGRTYWSAGAPVNISGDIDNAANINIDNNKKVSWKKAGATNYLSMLTLDASNNFVIGESMASEGLTTYVRGRSINFQTGTGTSGNHAASMSDAGLFTVEKLRIGSIVISEDTQKVGLRVENAGLYADDYISALGLSGGGGGGDVLAEPLVSINGIGTPTAANRTLVWNGTQWTFQPYGQGGGSVTSIRITVPTGFNVTPSTAITTAGTFAITFASGYSLPSTADQANWNTAYTNNHTHSNKSVLDGITSAKVSNWDTAYSKATTLEGYFDSSGNAKSALKLTTVSKTAWGRTYWTSGGVPDSISGDIEDAANIKIDNNKKVSWKKAGASNYLSMLTLDASNNFVIGESMANEGLATYVRGRSINFQTGTGSSGNHGASMSDAGLFTVEKLRIGSIVISEDTQNGGLHVESAGLYADNYISALGANSSGGGGVGDVTWSALASNSDDRQIAASHLNVLDYYVTKGTAQQISGTKTFLADLVMNANIRPGMTNYHTVGTSSYRFMKCYFRDGDLSGNLYVGGRVGIGGTNSSYPLYVNGVAYVKSLIVNGMNIEYDGQNSEYYIYTDNVRVYTDADWYGTWRSSSDIRLKNVVEHLNVSIEQIAKMPVFDFTWKEGKQGTYLGTSAQEIQKIFPNAVSKMKDGYLAMDYGAAALAAAVMTARKVVNHEERIRQLEKENEELRRLLNIA